MTVSSCINNQKVYCAVSSNQRVTRKVPGKIIVKIAVSGAQYQHNSLRFPALLFLSLRDPKFFPLFTCSRRDVLGGFKSNWRL